MISCRNGVEGIEADAPICVIGSGANLNAATDNGLQRAADLLDMPLGEVLNRATMLGGIEIGRHPGVVRVSLRVPFATLEEKGLGGLIREQYGLPD